MDRVDDDQQHPNSLSSPFDLFTAALHFRLLRQHGFNISCGILHKLMGENWGLKGSHCEDIKGLLSLYEASQLRTADEEDNVVLEEAFRSTAIQLKRWLQKQEQEQNVCLNLAKQVKSALDLPVHKCIPRFAARRFISIYEESDECDQSLLRLAKLDFKLLQFLYNQELSEIIRWANESEIISKLPYARARFVESYFVGLEMMYEPQYSFGRTIVAKTTLLITAIDDTYDSYGTLDELNIFTDVIQRWDAKESHRLPSFMETSYLALLSIFEDLEKELTRQGRLYAAKKYQEEWKNYSRTSYKEAHWLMRRELPTFSEYLENGLITGLAYLLISTALLAMEDANVDVYHWLAASPNILVSLAKICRLGNDVGSHKREKEISCTGVECYMREYDVTEKEAKAKFQEMVENAWKDMHKESLNLKVETDDPLISRQIVERLFNLGRIVNMLYKDGLDGFTDPRQVIEHYISAVLLEPIL